MNIAQAKEEIIRTFNIYRKYGLSTEQQRPILLIGPPGIGKTAIMKQIALETGTGLVSYTMTHHTRQSAVGLPILEETEYQGESYTTTRYTMSEIIASIYDTMKETGCKEGILFLDEVNCVSETLAPVMLELLQNKRFGTFCVPQGWMIVAAGNPSEYNKSVRELDIVTLDRVKNIAVEADIKAWLPYAYKKNIHGAVVSFLKLHPEQFYRIEDKASGRYFVTARGWEDLAVILDAFEKEGLEVTKDLVIQYIQHDETARSFFEFYTVYKHELRSPEIKANDSASAMASARLSVDALRLLIKEWAESSILVEQVNEAMRSAGFEVACNMDREGEIAAADALSRYTDERRRAFAVKLENLRIPVEERFREEAVLDRLDEVFMKLRLGQSVNVFLDEEREKAEHVEREIELAYSKADSAGKEVCEYVTESLAYMDDFVRYMKLYGSACFERHVV